MSELKKINPELKIAAGGRWVLDRNEDWARQRLPYADFLSLGCPDDVVELLVSPESWDCLELQKPTYSKAFARLDFSILHHFRHYQPVIELSRGCGSGCAFCLENSFPALSVKRPDAIIGEIRDIAALYGRNDLNIYFESSIFNPGREWAEEFRRLYKACGMEFRWRFTTRVDTLNPAVLPILAEAGLKVIDFGLESGSPRQLARMGKCRNQEAYLARAEAVLRTAGRYGIWVKLNILLYAGETEETIRETSDWLERNRGYYKGLSANPLMIYLNGSSTEGFIREVERLSGCLVHREELYKEGQTAPDLSAEISSERAFAACRWISENYMGDKDFNDLKSICYTPLEMDWRCRSRLWSGNPT